MLKSYNMTSNVLTQTKWNDSVGKPILSKGGAHLSTFNMAKLFCKIHIYDHTEWQKHLYCPAFKTFSEFEKLSNKQHNMRFRRFTNQKN